MHLLNISAHFSENADDLEDVPNVDPSKDNRNPEFWLHNKQGHLSFFVAPSPSAANDKFALYFKYRAK